MGSPATSVLPYALWPLLTLAIVALWIAAMLDITRHRHRGTFTGAGLLGMAALVSVVAVIAVAGVSAVFAAQWAGAMSRATSNGISTNKMEGEDQERAYIFSFGLENASYGSPVNSTGAKKSQNCVLR
jgi:hypothetical protein